MDHACAFATLGVSAGATPEEIRAAYRRRAFETHPDRTTASAVAFQAVAEAYRVLSDPSPLTVRDPGSAAGEGRPAHVPASDAARVLFEYLADLASEMILNGATPQTVVSFLAREGCPDSVARSLEQELRTRVWPTATGAGAGRPFAAVGRADVGDPAGPGAGVRARRATALGGPAVGVAAGLALCALLAWRLAGPPGPSEPPRAELAPSLAVVRAPQPSASAVGAAVPGAPARTRPREASVPLQRRSTRAAEGPSLGSVSASLDSERDALEADRDRLVAEAAELEREQQGIEAAQAAVGATPDPEQLGSLRRQEAAYEAHLEAARRTERALQRRARELNARILEYNARVLRNRI